MPFPLIMHIDSILTLATRSQVVRVGKHTSRPLTLNIGSPQGCVLIPILYSLYTHDCVARSSSIVKFVDDTVVVGLMSVNDEKSCVCVCV